MKKSFLLLIPTTAIILIGFCSYFKKNKPTATVAEIDPIAAGIEISQTLIEEGDPVDGIKTLEELNQRYPYQIAVLEALAFAHMGQKNHLEAGFYFESIAKLDNSQSNLFLKAAQSYEEEKEHDSSMRCYNHYLESHPIDGKIWKAYAKILIKKQQYENALQAYMRALGAEEGKPTPFEIVSIGKLFYKKGDLSQANDWYELGKSTAQSRPYALLGQAEVRIRQNNLLDSETLLSSLIEEYPAFKNQSPYLYLSQKLQEAKIKQEQQVISQTQIALGNERKSQTIQDSDDKTRTKGDITTAFVRTPVTILPSNEHSSVISSQTTLAAKPNQSSNQVTSFNSFANNSVIASHQNNLNTSEVTTIASRSNLTSSQLKTTDTANLDKSLISDVTNPSIQLDSDILVADTDTEENWLELSRAYLYKHDLKRAQSAALEAIRLKPNSEIATSNYINILNRKPNHNEYFVEINKLKQQFPQSAPIALAIGKAYEQKLNNLRNAYYTYLQFLENNPTHPQKTKIEAEVNRLYAKINPRSIK